MRYLLTFYAVEDEWMALSESERGAGIADIGQWFAEHARAGKIVEGHPSGARDEDRPPWSYPQERLTDGQRRSLHGGEGVGGELRGRRSEG